MRITPLVFMVTLVLGACATPGVADLSDCEDDAYSGVRATAPGSEVPREFAQFSGIWKGKWGSLGAGWRCSTLAVTSINRVGRADVHLSMATARGMSGFGKYYSGQISGGKLTFGRKFSYTFQFNSEGHLDGGFVAAGFTDGYITMLKMPRLLRGDIAPVKNKGIAKSPADFVGTWKGQFNSGRQHTLIVKNVTTSGVTTVVYALSEFRRFRASERRRVGKISNGVLTFTLKNTAQLTYWLYEKNVMHGKWKRGERQSEMVLEKSL